MVQQVGDVEHQLRRRRGASRGWCGLRRGGGRAGRSGEGPGAAQLAAAFRRDGGADGRDSRRSGGEGSGREPCRGARRGGGRSVLGASRRAGSGRRHGASRRCRVRRVGIGRGNRRNSGRRGGRWRADGHIRRQGAQRLRLAHGVGICGIEPHRPRIGRRRLRPPAEQLQHMADLQRDVGILRCQGLGLAVEGERAFQIAGFLQAMPALHHDRPGQRRHRQHFRIGARRLGPGTGIAQRIGTGQQGAGHACEPHRLLPPSSRFLPT